MSDMPESVIDPASWVDLQELDQHGEGLTEWEIEFVEDLFAWLRAGKALTDKQRDRLEAIREQRLG